jgi:hypothetical protein
MSTFTNVSFLYVLARFPAFLRHVRDEGASPDVIVRLAGFYELNVRVPFPPHRPQLCAGTGR